MRLCLLNCVDALCYYMHSISTRCIQITNLPENIPFDRLYKNFFSKLNWWSRWIPKYSIHFPSGIKLLVINMRLQSADLSWPKWIIILILIKYHIFSITDRKTFCNKYHARADLSFINKKYDISNPILPNRCPTSS